MSTAPTPLQARLGLLANCCAVFMTVMDCLIVNVALESMRQAMGADLARLQWVVDAYTLSYASCLLVAGAMGDMGDMKATDSWKIYLDTDDMAKTLEAAGDAGAQIIAPAEPVADLGIQAVLIDPTGAHHGAWEPGTFPGFTVLNEHGAPSWFELQTGDYPTAVAFYRSVYRWDTDTVGDSDEFRYTTMRHPEGEGELAGIMDAAAFLPDGVPAHWSIYWEVDEADAAVARARALGGAVVMEATDTPYGRLATVTDPAGAPFKLRTPNR